MPPNLHSLGIRVNFTRPWHLNYSSQSHFCIIPSNLRAEQVVWTISDAIFLFPVTRNSTPNLHSLSQRRNVFFMLTIRYVKLTISLQKHWSPGTATAVLIACERRRISTSGLEQNAAKRAQLRHTGKFHATVTPQLQFTLTFLPYTVKSQGRTSRLAYK